MAIQSITNAEYPTPSELLAQLLSEYRYAYERINVTVNVAKGTEPYLRMQALSNRLSIAIQNNKLALADISPLDAAGDALEELCGTYGVSRRPASAAAGLLVVSTVPITAIVLIPTGFQCTAPNGIQYQVTAAAAVGNGGLIEVQAVTTGADTEQLPAVVMTWDSAAIANLGQNATVSAGGIDGGSDEDTDDELRQRLLRHLSFPQVGGNSSQVIAFAEDASSATEAAFCYPAVRGPGSYDVAVTVAGSDRVMSTVQLNAVASAIAGQMPGAADLNCTTVNPQQLDIIMSMSLPLPVNAGGAGGGWRDAAPWPSTADVAAGTSFTRVTGCSTGTFTVNSTAAADTPVVGKRFGVWDPLTSTMHEYTIAPPVLGGPGAYTFTTTGASTSWLEDINAELAGGTIYRYISAGAVNLKSYAAEVLAGILALGPGEKTASVDILPRGRRNPPPDTLWPMDVNTRMLSPLYAAHDEISNIEYINRYEANGIVARTTPGIPATTSDAPRIVTLNSVAFVYQV